MYTFLQKIHIYLHMHRQLYTHIHTHTHKHKIGQHRKMFEKGSLREHYMSLCTHTIVITPPQLGRNHCFFMGLIRFPCLIICSIYIYIYVMCVWNNDYSDLKWTQLLKFKSWMRLFAFHIALIALGMYTSKCISPSTISK